MPLKKKRHKHRPNNNRAFYGKYRVVFTARQRQLSEELVGLQGRPYQPLTRRSQLSEELRWIRSGNPKKTSPIERHVFGCPLTRNLKFSIWRMPCYLTCYRRRPLIFSWTGKWGNILLCCWCEDAYRGMELDTNNLHVRKFIGYVFYFSVSFSRESRLFSLNLFLFLV